MVYTSTRLLSVPKSGEHLPDSDDIAKVHGDLVNIGNEECGHCLVQRCTVHVDCGAHGNHECADTWVHVIVHLQTVESYWHCCRTEIIRRTVNDLVRKKVHTQFVPNFL